MVGYLEYRFLEGRHPGLIRVSILWVARCVKFFRRENQSQIYAFSQFPDRLNRARTSEVFQTKGYYCAPRLLCFDYVPPTVFSEGLCRKLRLRRP